MRKALSFVLTLMLLLALAGSALPESAEAIPGTDFPSPDTLTGIRAVSVQVQEIPEETEQRPSRIGAQVIKEQSCVPLGYRIATGPSQSTAARSICDSSTPLAGAITVIPGICDRNPIS